MLLAASTTTSSLLVPLCRGREYLVFRTFGFEGTSVPAYVAAAIQLYFVFFARVPVHSYLRLTVIFESYWWRGYLWGMEEDNDSLLK
jgi:hypothetical protein